MIRRWYSRMVAYMPVHVRIAVCVLVAATLAVVGVSMARWGTSSYQLDGILVEAHGMLLDILVLGVITLWLSISADKRMERASQIRRWREEIDDYRRWTESEAMFRITGNVKRLNAVGESQVNLSECHLGKAHLTAMRLMNSSAENAVFDNAMLDDAEIVACNLRNSSFVGSQLNRVDLDGSILTSAHFEGASLSHATMRMTDLTNAKFTGANLTRAVLSAALLKNSAFDGADLAGAVLENATLAGADFSKANLAGSNLNGVRQWEKIKSVERANISATRAAPEGFVKWALERGAVIVPSENDFVRYHELLRREESIVRVLESAISVLQIWSDKAEYLQEAEVVANDASTRFKLTYEINEAKERLGELQQMRQADEDELIAVRAEIADILNNV
jgi:BTB/POZ domain-containing protein KCTD9